MPVQAYGHILGVRKFQNCSQFGWLLLSVDRWRCCRHGH